MRVAVVSNPHSGNYSKRKIVQLGRALSRTGHDVSFHDSLTFGSENEAEECDLVCISGGDGTVRTVINNAGASFVRTTYCIHPVGTINLAAREARYAADPQCFVSDISSRKSTKSLYAGRLSDQIFLTCASIGPDSRVVARVSVALKKRIGRLAYLVAFLGLLLSWPRQIIDIVVDGAAMQVEGVFVFKGRFFAGPWTLDPLADASQDSFRLLILDRARRRDYLRLVGYAMFGAVFADPKWRRMSARTIEVRGPGNIPIQADGDILAHSPATISICSQPLRFL